VYTFGATGEQVRRGCFVFSVADARSMREATAAPESLVPHATCIPVRSLLAGRVCALLLLGL